ncbi:hypothetical protein SODALDRAFT_50153 [Sodiomyces alkalinus F11]|uniref:Uncharacterized protein n=1 Tax=Sodiomyces alkalinus (strain CBS 110278 / VKM F-3762 / F11) TaxID=1314773 RepID=A0A3N2PMP2_SODAK|nr:hypothetical protein SODALDRAFT_50153 [Sodiomyces alkalinus F11]ROT35739.1 hypothetical protein SODALDRAFT_50153 [Sodiomyces alkalinus F11]
MIKRSAIGQPIETIAGLSCLCLIAAKGRRCRQTWALALRTTRFLLFHLWFPRRMYIGVSHLAASPVIPTAPLSCRYSSQLSFTPLPHSIH